MKLLLSEGVCPSEFVLMDSESTSALHLVCHKLGDLDLLKLLASKECNINVQDSNGCTPLHYACSKGYIDLAIYLILDLKCNPNVKDYDGKTSLHTACACSLGFLDHQIQHLRIILLLINEAGCDCNAVTNKGETPLMLLCRSSNNKSIAEELIHVRIGNHTHSSPIWEIIVLSNSQNCTRRS